MRRGDGLIVAERTAGDNRMSNWNASPGMVSGRAGGITPARGSVCVGVTVVSWVVVGDGGDSERRVGGWWCFFSLPHHSKALSLTVDLPAPRQPSSGAERQLWRRTSLHSSLLSDINHITNTSHARWLSVRCDANLIWIWIRSRRLCVAPPAVSPLWSGYIFLHLVQNLFVADRLTWIGMVNTPKWEVKCFERFLQTPAVGEPNLSSFATGLKKYFFTKILFLSEKLVSSNN